MIFSIQYKKEIVKAIAIVLIAYLLQLRFPFVKLSHFFIILSVIFLAFIIEIIKGRKYIVNNKNLEIHSWGKYILIPLKSINRINRHQVIISNRGFGGGGFQYYIIYNDKEYELSSNLYNSEGKSIIDYLNQKHNKQFKESLGKKKIF